MTTKVSTENNGGASRLMYMYHQTANANGPMARCQPDKYGPIDELCSFFFKTVGEWLRVQSKGKKEQKEILCTMNSNSLKRSKSLILDGSIARTLRNISSLSQDLIGGVRCHGNLSR